MDEIFWHKQTRDKALFPDLLWSRPETRTTAGKLLIIGGNAFGFAAPGEAFTEAGRGGVGETRVVLPDRLRSTVGNVLAAEFAPSNASGSFSQKALDQLLIDSNWADGVLLAGDLGRNSETAVLLEKFCASYHGQLTIAKDSVDYFTAGPQTLLARPKTTLVLSFAQLQKIGTQSKFQPTFTFSMDLVRLVEALHNFTTQYSVNIVVKHLENIVVAAGGQVSTTKLESDLDIWRVKVAPHAAVWWLQNPSKPFEAITTALYDTLK